MPMSENMSGMVNSTVKWVWMPAQFQKKKKKIPGYFSAESEKNINRIWKMMHIILPYEVQFIFFLYVYKNDTQFLWFVKRHGLKLFLKFWFSSQLTISQLSMS